MTLVLEPLVDNGNMRRGRGSVLLVTTVCLQLTFLAELLCDNCKRTF